MSSTAASTFRGRLEAADVYFGPSACRSWVFSADATSDTDSEYIDLNYINEEGVEVLGYVWFNVAGAGTDPAPAGKTGIAEVAYAEDASGDTRANALITALDALVTRPLFFYEKSTTATVVIDNAYPGAVTAETESGSSNIVEAELRAGAGGLLGPTKEAISVSTETSLFDVTSNQTGELIIDRIIQGSNVSLSAAFLDVSAANKEVLIGRGAGDTITSGSNTIVGIGKSKLFQNTSDLGGRLILHPIRLDRTDRSADLCIWSTFPSLEEIPYDGTDTQALSVSFSANLDESRKDEINLATFGTEWISNDVLV